MVVKIGGNKEYLAMVAMVGGGWMWKFCPDCFYFFSIEIRSYAENEK